MVENNFTVERVTGALGAVVYGIDLSVPLSDDAFAKLESAWLEHQVLFFREQRLTNDQFEAFVRRFGDVEIHPFIGKVEGSEIVEQLDGSQESDYTPSTSTYHIDVSMMAVPTKGAALYAVDVAEAGGDTIWVNAYAAYDALSEPMKAFLEQRRGLFVAMHRRALDAIIRAGPAGQKAAAGFLQNGSEHPLVHTHPETGRKALFVDALFLWSIVDLHPDESDALKAFLFQHVAKPEFQCRFRWRPGSVAIWDNRCTMHRRVDDVRAGPRIMHRIPIKGTEAPRS
jgi:taurine dioxygenase